MKRVLFPLIVIFSLIFSLSGPIPVVQASSPLPVLDFDQDGISNAMETNGWYNLSGGPYVTDPYKADSDQDGLSDSEEKLFNTDPNNPFSPGIAVAYDSSFKTREYYSTSDPAYLAMVAGGNGYLLPEGVVVRRGTTFRIAASNSPSANLTISGPGMTGLTPVRDFVRGGWNVTLPAGGTVGTYTATISNGTWSKSLPIYVIFELPTGLTNAQTQAFLYDDDPANKRDEVSVWWRAVDWSYYNVDSETPTPCNPSDPICSDWQYHTLAVYAQAFWTEQFTKKVFLEYSLPAINGMTTLYDAAQAIGIKSDQSVRINFASVKNSFSSATKVNYYPQDPAHPTTPYSTDGGGCETSAGVQVSMLRSVGIASQTFALDYNKTSGHGEGGNFAQYEYDHAVVMWIKSPTASANQWYAQRNFNDAESEYQSTSVWSSGTTTIRLLSDAGIYSATHPELQFKKFQDYYSDVIQVANEGWDFQNGSLGGGMVNTVWSGSDVPPSEFEFQNRDLKWNSKTPLVIQQSPFVDILNCQLWKGDNWAPSEWYDFASPKYQSNPTGWTAASTYSLPAGIPSAPGDIENWPYNPQPTSCSASTSPEACDAFKATWSTTCAPLPGQTIADAPATLVQPVQNTPSALNQSVQIGKILSNSGLDQTGDGLFDKLAVKFELTSSVAGEYQVGGWLRAGDLLIRADVTRVQLTSGVQTLQLAFDGQQIGDNKVNGPFQVETIWLAPASQSVSELTLPEEMAAYQTFNYASQPYKASAFVERAASITGGYSFTALDTNANGSVDSLSISVPLNIALPGTFVVEGDLYDGVGKYVGHAKWTGAGAAATLDYQITGSVAPYSLEHLNLSDSRGKDLASFYAPVFTVDALPGSVELSTVQSANQVPVSAPQATINLTNQLSVQGVDTNANGHFDKLVVSVNVDIAAAGTYWVEGLLVNETKSPIAWSITAPQAMAAGSNQIMELSFDGRMLYDRMPLTASQRFTLTALKIFSGPLEHGILEASLDVTGFDTPNYVRGHFDTTTPVALFQDDMENMAVKWSISAPSQWSLASTVWNSSNHAWKTNGSANQSGLLSIADPLDFSNYAISPWLRFATTYQLADGESVKLEASTDGVAWTTLKTFTGKTVWLTQLVDLSAYGKNAHVMIRFNAQSNPGSLWAIDDVYVTAGPQMTSASFTYAGALDMYSEVSFTADYVSPDMTLPVLYKWDFCGWPQESSSPTVIHKFVKMGDCVVNLRVDNLYSTVDAAPQTVSINFVQMFITFLPMIKR